MKAPRPHFHASRLNVGGYRVTVHGQFMRVEIEQENSSTPTGGLLCSAKFRRILYWKPVTTGALSADGSLSVVPEAWRSRHRRRAVMHGAGVYRLGLWAFLAARRDLSFTVPEPGAIIEPHRVKMRAHDRVSVHDLGTEWAQYAALNPHLTVPHVDVGRVTPDGELSWAGRRQRAVYYRRAVMGGAGVYRLGLWAFLAARRDLNFTVPEPGASIEPHRVTIQNKICRGPHANHNERWTWFYDVFRWRATFDGPWTETGGPNGGSLEFPSGAEVTPGGALLIAPVSFITKRYQRGYMRSAGVYLAGLWALMTPGHTREHLQGAQPFVNTGRMLDAWAERAHAPPAPPAEVLTRMTHRQIRRSYGAPVADRVFASAVGLASSIAQGTGPLAVVQSMASLFSGAGLDPSTGTGAYLRAALQHAEEAVRAAYSAAARTFLPRGKASRAARRAFHAVKREVLRFLRRMVPRRAAHRPAVRAPRPLYAQGIPPAAPLAPPAL